MGWASGSCIAEELWEEIKPLIKKGKTQEAAKMIVDAFEQNDADDWNTEPGSLFYMAYPKICEENE